MNTLPFSNGFINKLIELSEGLISPQAFEEIVTLLEKEVVKYSFTSSSESNLLRIINSVYDRTTFFNELLKYPHHKEIIIAVTASSNYLTDIVVRNPEYMYQLFDQNYLEEKLSLEPLQKELHEGINKFSTFAGRLNYLRQVKKRYTLKIGLTDILEIHNLKTVTEHLAIMAKGINAELFDLCYNEILGRYNLTLTQKKYCLCSLGKLGGRELNYSSDVDLLLFYDDDLHLKSVKKEYQEILTEAALLFVKSSTEISERGYIYRVDFRLRPDGLYSPLCRKLSDYIRYYETRGEDWERQMLIKLDFVCGNEKLYKQFYDFLQPYIFPASFSASLKDQIKKMKASIELNNKGKENVKLFSGGIRDIEFSVQALQLLNGGRFKNLRTGNSLAAIELLSGYNLLKRKETKIFTDAYIFYRKIEHFLQLMNDTQTHLIPESGELLEKLTSYLKLPSSSDLKKKIDITRKNVRLIYDSILISDDKEREIAFKKINFAEPGKAEKNIRYLRTGAGLLNQKEFDARTINLFEKIEPALLKYLKTSAAPDNVLDNFVKIIRAASLLSIWYNEFTDEKFFKLFLRVCEYSAKAVNILCLDKSAAELFLTRKVFDKIEIDESVHFTPSQLVFILSVQFACRLVTTKQISQIFCANIDELIRRPAKAADIKCNYFIAALGSYGSNSMSFSSDIDLIFIAERIDPAYDAQKEFQKLFLHLQNILRPFEIDARLRAEGKNSPLAWGIKEYKEYLNSRARVWEFQALTKLRLIYGNNFLFDEAKSSIIFRIQNLSGTEIRKEILNMHKTIQKEISFSSKDAYKIKKQNGGLTTIDFIMQSLLLGNKKYFKYFGLSTGVILKKISAKDFPDLKKLAENYESLRKIEFTMQNLLNVSTASFSAGTLPQTALKFLRHKSTGDFENQLKEIFKNNIKLFEKYAG
ncbi:MAG: hypothetical protein HYS25_09815 [Ignavibacteriales bacterium]|nr:hypothetical protein [Ignavibacteriales bacterium]